MALTLYLPVQLVPLLAAVPPSLGLDASLLVHQLAASPRLSVAAACSCAPRTLFPVGQLASLYQSAMQHFLTQSYCTSR